MNIEESYKLVVEQQLEENILKRTLAATAIAGASLLPTQVTHDQRDATSKDNMSVMADHAHSIERIVSHYKIDREKAKKIVTAAVKYSKFPFPQVHHLLGTMGVESSFDKDAKSNLKYDPAVGLMQVRPKVNGIDPTELASIDGQIKHGASILHQLYSKTGDIDKTLQAYNLGLTAFNRGKRAYHYVEKTKLETQEHARTISEK